MHRTTEMLLNAQSVSETLPNFYVPNPERLNAIHAGWVVKVESNGERFWVVVTSAPHNSRSVVGRVDNHLVEQANRLRWPYGCTMELSRDNVLDAQGPQDRDAFSAASVGYVVQDLVVPVDCTKHRPCAGGHELFQKYLQHSQRVE